MYRTSLPTKQAWLPKRFDLLAVIAGSRPYYRPLSGCMHKRCGTVQRLAGVWMLAPSLQWSGVRRAFHNQQCEPAHSQGGMRLTNESCPPQRARYYWQPDLSANTGDSQRQDVVTPVVKSLCAASYFNPMPNESAIRYTSENFFPARLT